MELIELVNGPVLPAQAVLLALALEERGLRLHQQEPGVLRVAGPTGRPDLSEQDICQIKEFKLHLLALVAYCEAH